MELKEVLRLDLASAIARAEAQNEELLVLLREAEKDGSTLHPVILEVGRDAHLTMAEVRQMNADLFEMRPDDVERKLRLALDDVLRVQMNTLGKLLKLPPREG